MKAEKLHNYLDSRLVKYGVFVVVILLMSLIYNYDEVVKMRPTSMHQWRNSVSASMALNYYYEGEFLHPRTHNMQADDFSSDVSVVEFPLFYYIVGKLYHIFGPHEWVYRLLNILVGFTGLFFLYLLGLRLFKNILYALFLPVVIFSAPIFIYYINNFILDATTLAMGFVAFYYFYRFYERGKISNFIITMLILAIAGLMKTPALLLYFAIAGVFIIELLFKLKFRANGKLFEKWGIALLAFSGVMIMIISWYAYSKYYTDQHGGVVSPVEIRPIWILGKDSIAAIKEAMEKRLWNGNYHASIVLFIALALFIHNLIFWKRYNRLLSTLSVLLVLGGTAFTLFFFRSMLQHDYYQLNNLIILAVVFLNFFLYVKKHHPGIFQSLYSKIVLIIFMGYMIYAANNRIQKEYYGGWYMDYTWEHYNNRYDHITPYLRSLGIDRYDKVYVTFDPSINISLYLMDQKGFTDFHRRDSSFSKNFSLYREKGLQYLIIGDYDRPDVPLSTLGVDSIGAYNGVGIYRVDKTADQ